MYEYKKYKSMYIISAICLICFASTFLLMPISNYVPIEYSRISAMIIGVFLLGIICSILVLSLKIASTYFGYITIFILVLSLNLHFIFSRNILGKLERKRGGFEK